jgi:hypothetical protein
MTAPSNSFRVADNVLVALDCELKGKVSIGRGTPLLRFERLAQCIPIGSIFHPRCTVLDAAGGGIEFGEDCLVEENCVILNRCGRVDVCFQSLTAMKTPRADEDWLR